MTKTNSSFILRLICHEWNHFTFSTFQTNGNSTRWYISESLWRRFWVNGLFTRHQSVRMIQISLHKPSNHQLNAMIIICIAKKHTTPLSLLSSDFSSASHTQPPPLQITDDCCFAQCAETGSKSRWRDSRSPQRTERCLGLSFSSFPNFFCTTAVEWKRSTRS